MRQSTEESLSPNPECLAMDVTCVVNDGQASNQRVVAVQGQGINMDRGDSHPQKSLGVVIVFQGLQNNRRSAFHQRLQRRRYGNRMSLCVVHSQTGEMFPVGELLDSSLQSALRVPLKIVLHIAGETLSQHLSTAV